MSVLHTIYIAEANCPFENIELEDIETRNNYASKTPTTTFPFLETKEGNISESKAIELYLCSKYKPELLGESVFEKAKVNQWIEFASCELNRCVKAIIYPIFVMLNLFICSTIKSKHCIDIITAIFTLIIDKLFQFFCI